MEQKQLVSNKDAFGITYDSLDLLNSTKGLLNNNTKAKYYIALGFISWIVLFALGAITIGFLCLFAAIGYILSLMAKRNKQIWIKFASDNSWKIGPATLAENYVPPSLSGIGHSRKLGDVIEGSFSGNNFRLFVYSYTVGSGKHSHTYTYTIMQHILPKQLPSFIVDSQRVDGSKNIPSNYEKVSLEGNFDDSFSLYIPKGASVDVLSILSPDVMQTLITSNTMQDIESGIGYVWFIQSGDTRGQKMLPKLFTAADTLANEFMHRLKTYKVTNTSAHTATLQQGDGMAAQGGNGALILKDIGRSTFARTIIIVSAVFFCSIFIFIVFSILYSIFSSPFGS